MGVNSHNNKYQLFGWTRQGLEPMIYRTWGEHANHYATDAMNVVDYGFQVRRVKTTTSKLVYVAPVFII